MKDKEIIDFLMNTLTEENYPFYEVFYGRDIVREAWERKIQKRVQDKSKELGDSLKDYYKQHKKNYNFPQDNEGEEWKTNSNEGDNFDQNLYTDVPPPSQNFQGFGDMMGMDGHHPQHFEQEFVDDEEFEDEEILYGEHEGMYYMGDVSDMPWQELPTEEDSEIICEYIYHAVVRNHNGKIIFDNWINEIELEEGIFDLYSKVVVLVDEPMYKEFKVSH
jgi:hypothetical protein